MRNNHKGTIYQEVFLYKMWCKKRGLKMSNPDALHQYIIERDSK